jgi:hypothetical protein
MSFAHECQVVRDDYIDGQAAAIASKSKFTILETKTQASMLMGAYARCFHFGKNIFPFAGKVK